MEKQKQKPPVTLRDGNAFSIMAACRRAGLRAGWTIDQTENVLREMREGDYDHLLRVAQREFDITVE